MGQPRCEPAQDKGDRKMQNSRVLPDLHQTKGTLVAQLMAHLRLPLYRNGYALLLSGLLSSGLGMVYWVLAAQYYPANVVGLNSAAIAALMLLSGLSQMSMNSALIRFIPRTGRATSRLILACYGVSSGIAVVAGLLYALGAPYWTPALAPYLQQPTGLALFILSIAAWSIYALQDSVLAGLRQAAWVPIENGLGALLKIGLLLAFTTLLPVYGIFAAWMVPVFLSLPPVNLLILGRLAPLHARTAPAHAGPSRTEVSRYVLGNYIGTLCYLGYTTLLPILVTVRLSPSANAYFYMPWMLAGTLQLIALNLTTSLTVEGAWEERKLGLYCVRILKQALYLVTPLVVLFLIGAPWLLRLFGSAYAQEGAPLLRLLTLATLPNILVMLQLSVARIQNQTSGVIWAQGLLCALLLGVSYLLLPTLGIAAVGWAALVAQITVAGIALATTLRPLLKPNVHRLQPAVTA